MLYLSIVSAKLGFKLDIPKLNNIYIINKNGVDKGMVCMSIHSDHALKQKNESLQRRKYFYQEVRQFVKRALMHQQSLLSHLDI